MSKRASSKPRAVRWATKLARTKGVPTRWHYTLDGAWTGCGVNIKVAAQKSQADTSEDLERIDCRRCLAFIRLQQPVEKSVTPKARFEYKCRRCANIFFASVMERGAAYSRLNDTLRKRPPASGRIPTAVPHSCTEPAGVGIGDLIGFGEAPANSRSRRVHALNDVMS